jgi:hypothetical protein
VTKPLETPKELAERVGLPVTNIRYLIRADMLEHIYTAPGQCIRRATVATLSKSLNI